jgi:hypothetical protein
MNVWIRFRKKVASIVAMTALGVGAHAFPAQATEAEIQLTEEQAGVAEILRDSREAKDLPVSEIQEFVKGVDPEKTCMDEMLARRKQLVRKLSLKPLVAPVQLVGVTFLAAKAGLAIGKASGGEMADLAGFVAGLVYGVAGVIIYTGIDTTKAGLELHRLNVILKTLGEQYLKRPGSKSDELYAMYLKKEKESPLPKARLMELLVEANENGTLCDGSMKKRRWVRLGPKLKYRVANARDFANSPLKLGTGLMDTDL